MTRRETGCTHNSNTHARGFFGKFSRQAFDLQGVLLWKCTYEGIASPEIQNAQTGAVWKVGIGSAAGSAGVDLPEIKAPNGG
jgi:hypothetical protein